MWLWVLAAGCLVNTDLYEERLQELTSDDDCANAVWFADDDGDGFGDPAREQTACTQPDATAAVAGDCDDQQALAWDGATEIPYDGIDNDCVDGDADDLDGDGAVGAPAGGPDCDDSDPAVHPDAVETWADGVTDNDCDGALDTAVGSFGTDAVLGSSAGGQFGRRLAPIGDVDDDGLAEFLVGAVYEGSVDDYAGAVYLLDGAGGDRAADFPTLIGPAPMALLGTVAGGEDIDGDGVPDALVAATNVDDGTGAAWLISGAAFAQLDAERVDDVALAEFLGPQTASFSGTDAAFVGDLDGDGVIDLAIGAPFASPDSTSRAGSVSVWAGNNRTGGVASDADQVLDGWFEDQELGTTVAPAGDLDGDGYADLLLGGAGVLGTIVAGGATPIDPEDDALFTLYPEEDGERCDPHMVGDLDGDGEVDLGCTHETGRFLLYTDLLATPERSTGYPTAVVEVGVGSYSFDMVDLGDLDGDGRSETLLPLKWHEADGTSAVGVLFGSDVSFSAQIEFDELALRSRCDRPFAGYGYRAIAVPDTDGDGGSDIVLSTGGDSEAGTDAGGITLLPVPR